MSSDVLGGYISSDLSELSDSDSEVELNLVAEELGAPLIDIPGINSPKPVITPSPTLTAQRLNIVADPRNYGRDLSSRIRKPKPSSSITTITSSSSQKLNLIRRNLSSRGKRSRSRNESKSEEDSEEEEVGLQFVGKRTKSNRVYKISNELVSTKEVVQDDAAGIGRVESTGKESNSAQKWKVGRELSKDTGEGKGKNVEDTVEESVPVVSSGDLGKGRSAGRENLANLENLTDIEADTLAEHDNASQPFFPLNFPPSTPPTTTFRTSDSSYSDVSTQSLSTPFFSSSNRTASPLPIYSPFSSSKSSPTSSTSFTSIDDTNTVKIIEDIENLFSESLPVVEDPNGFESSFNPMSFSSILAPVRDELPSPDEFKNDFVFHNKNASQYTYPLNGYLPVASTFSFIPASPTRSSPPDSHHLYDNLETNPSNLTPVNHLDLASTTSLLPADPIRTPFSIESSNQPPTKPFASSSTFIGSIPTRVAIPIAVPRNPPSVPQSSKDYVKMQKRYKFAPFRVVPLAPNALLQAASFLLNPELLPPLPPLPLPTNVIDPEVKKLASEKKWLKKEKDKSKLRNEYKVDKKNWIEPESLSRRANGMPPIWCQGRQELCEALPYFKSYQGGHYDRDEICHGYLLDGFPSPMDKCEHGGLVIISHGGGCSDPSPSTSTYQLISDQDRDNLRVRALINCFNSGTPVVLIAGKNYTHFPWLGENGIRYAVLGYYLVTSYWAEGEPTEIETRKEGKPDYFVRYKFRFEWQPSQGVPWFSGLIPGSDPMQSLSTMAKLSLGSYLTYSNTSIEQTACDVCRKLFPSVYVEEVSCYDDDCANFFKVDGVMIHPSKLHSLSTFLKPIQSPLWERLAPLSLSPPALEHDVSVSSISSPSRQYWKAFHCRKCGRLSTRAAWDRLICATSCCGTSISAGLRIQSASEQDRGRARQSAIVEGGIRISEISVEGYVGVTIHLSDDAKVHHLWSESTKQTAADRLFEMYQQPESANLFKRNPLSTHRVAGQIFCNHYSFNAGEEYKFCVKVDTIPLNQAPSAVQVSCNQLTRISEAIIKVPSQAQYNEVLSVAYMEAGKMSFHDDGETGLGPIISSLSLGSAATMSFRAKTKKSKNNVLAKGAAKNAKIIVKLDLRHGDITIMEHEDLQKKYEHKVEASGLRFAATARSIHSKASPSGP